MVSFLVTIASVFATASLTVANGLAVGEYFRPTFDVSGDPNNTTATYRRTPCPGLNVIANHGYIARDGKNITKADMRAALLKVFNLEAAVFDTFPVPIPDVFDLNIFGRHNYFEHDVSLVHPDSYLGKDPSYIDPAMVQDVVRRGSATSPLTVETLGHVLKDRETECKTKNPSCRYSAAARAGAMSSAASTLSIFGDAATNTITVDRFVSFLALEKFPDDWVTPAKTMTQASIDALAAKVDAVASA